MRLNPTAIAITTLLALPNAAAAQTNSQLTVAPATVTIEVGAKSRLVPTLKDASGTVVTPDTVVFLSDASRSLDAGADGTIEAVQEGQYVITVLARAGGQTATARVPVTVRPPAPARVEVLPALDRLYAGAAMRFRARVTDRVGAERPDQPVTWESSAPAVATVDRGGLLSALAPGEVVIRARTGEVVGERRYRVVANPVASLALETDRAEARTGDVVHFRAVAKDARGNVVSDAPVTFAVVPQKGVPVTHEPQVQRFREGSVQRELVPRYPAAEIDERGRFVAEDAGEFTVLASGPGHSAFRTIRITPREVSRKVELVGRGAVTGLQTSDLWIFEGVDGRDYAITGTHSANGEAYFWDVTDPGNPVAIDTVTVDARTVNDVKVSEDGRIAVISREGASTRRNGIVILDVTNPRQVETLSVFDDQLTGGVHNVFVAGGHVYVVNNLQRLDVISIEDPRAPRRVSTFEVDTPAHLIHDVWVVDGIAYVSYVFDGVILLDVGNGVAGGSPSNPVRIASYAYPVDVSGEVSFAVPAHSAFPYRSSTGRSYVLVGDESFRRAATNRAEGAPAFETTGYIHVVDFTDPKNPEEVARVEVPEAGSHNYWIQGDTLYAGFYNGGLRVFDLSGELKGDLYRQGREIASYLPYDPKGLIPNSPRTWGAQWYKGNIFLSDTNSGLWVVRLEPKKELVP
ncbi:MAG: Ig-like domain-containing protein [Gemmatimonadales bacterium]